MWKIRSTFSIDFNMKAIEMYLHRGTGSKLIGRELEVTYSVIDRWIKNHNNERFLGLQEKRGKSRKTRQTNGINQEDRIKRLEAENIYLKKLLVTKKGMRSKEINQ
ncbi:transposase [Bacillus thuringiensis]